ncbi:MAG: hypothetical protein QOH88_3480 [Verrucomicrobiota bacterium]|jgi:hypothetical protein
MKTALLALIASTLLCISSYADEGPTFLKVGSTYALTAAPGITLPHLVTIAAVGGGGWFRVTTPKENAPPGPGPQHMEDLGDRWINFNQVIMVREAVPHKGPK